jgi:hypothetical protein
MPAETALTGPIIPDMATVLIAEDNPFNQHVATNAQMSQVPVGSCQQWSGMSGYVQSRSSKVLFGPHGLSYA